MKLGHRWSLFFNLVNLTLSAEIETTISNQLPNLKLNAALSSWNYCQRSFTINCKTTGGHINSAGGYLRNL